MNKDEQIWNSFSRIYVTYLEKFHLSMAQILFDSLSIKTATNVLETGTGGGYNLKSFLIQKPKSCHWCATDVSDTMLSICSERITEFIKDPFNEIQHDYMTQQFSPFKEIAFKDQNVSIRKADSHNLEGFQSESFDRYFANQVVGHQQERVAILKEAWRVLKPQGMLGITVLGRKENCKYVTIFKETAIEQGMEESKFPQNDHLNSTEKDIILNEIMQIGFDIQMQYYVALPITDADKICEAQLNYQSLLRMQLEKAGANEEMIEKVKNAIIQKCKKQLEDTKEPLTVEAFYIIAIKK